MGLPPVAPEHGRCLIEGISKKQGRKPTTAKPFLLGMEIRKMNWWWLYTPTISLNSRSRKGLKQDWKERCSPHMNATALLMISWWDLQIGKNSFEMDFFSLI